jgi:protoporphyrin/coproporphyrin ferrochelatase
VTAPSTDTRATPHRPSSSPAAADLHEPRSHGERDQQTHQYDAILYLSFGGPEAMEEVMPFMEHVTRGRGIPRERLEEVSEHYELFGGVSPINAQNRAVIAGLEQLLADEGPDLPIYWGNRNSAPFVAQTVRQMREDGVERAICFATAAFSSWSSCRQYRNDIEHAREHVGTGAPAIDKLRTFHDHPGFIEPQTDRVRVALEAIPEDRRADAHLTFVAHSIPVAMAAASSYVPQLRESSRLVAERVGGTHDWELVWQSRSGPPHVPWLEPDIVDHLGSIADAGTRDVVVVPIGFVSDHIEVQFDLDVEAARAAAEVGLHMVRAGTVGAHPRYVRMIRDLVLERMEAEPLRPSLGELGPGHDICATTCCEWR